MEKLGFGSESVHERLPPLLFVPVSHRGLKGNPGNRECTIAGLSYI
jgi:hypothetical protein